MVCVRSSALFLAKGPSCPRNTYGHSSDVEIETIETHRFQILNMARLPDFEGQSSAEKESGCGERALMPEN